MPGYEFGDAENFSSEIAKGDYEFEILSVDTGVISKGTTAGSDHFDLKVLLRGKDGKKVGQIISTLIFHAKCYWVIDCFLKSANFLINGKPPAKGQRFELEAADCVGLRGWCHVEPEADKNDASKKYNRVKAWLTDRAKLARSVTARVDARPPDASPAGEEEVAF